MLFNLNVPKKDMAGVRLQPDEFRAAGCRLPSSRVIINQVSLLLSIKENGEVVVFHTYLEVVPLARTMCDNGFV